MEAGQGGGEVILPSAGVGGGAVRSPQPSHDHQELETETYYFHAMGEAIRSTKRRNG